MARIKQIEINRFLRYFGVFSQVQNVSPYSIARDVLVERGFIKKHGEDDKRFVARHAWYIRKRQANKLQQPKESVSFSDIKQVASKSIKKQDAVAGNKEKSNEFLRSYEWRKLRMVAIKLYGRTCMCCSATPDDGAVMNVDHIKPRSKYPSLSLELSNLQILCSECNHGKGNWDHTDWRTKDHKEALKKHLERLSI